MDIILKLIQDSPSLLLSLVVVLGLCIGSFLNVIIYRLPLRIEQEWRNECDAYLKMSSTDVTSAPFKLWGSHSCCPHCKTRLRLRDNVPLPGYLFPGGACAHCQKPVSVQYPLVELSCALLGVLVVAHFGYSWQTLAGLFFTWLLIIMAGIDIKHQMLPDVLTYIGIWAGLLSSLYNVFTDSHSAIIGGLAGYLSLWAVANSFKLLTGKEGMGYGDFKLFALLGVWLGWQWLIPVILIAASSGTVIGMTAIVFKKADKDTPVPFGPFLALAGWLVLIGGKDLLFQYLL